MTQTHFQIPTQRSAPLTAVVRIGFTEPDRVGDYSPMSDGYRPGAAQRELVIPAPHGEYDIEELAEAVFEATNAPHQVDGIAAQIRRALAGQRVRSLSVGDTVRLEVPGNPSAGVACARLGWEALA